MAARAAWKGKLSFVGGLLTIPVEAWAATGKYAGNEPLKELCACHQQPIDRSHRCSVTNEPPQGKVKAVARPDGSFAVLSEQQVNSIKVAGDKGDIEVLSCVPAESAPIYSASDLWWLAGDHKEAGSGEAVNTLYGALQTVSGALIVRVLKDGRQHIVALHPVDGKLAGSRLRYPQELVSPSVDVLRGQGPSKAIEMLASLLGELPQTFDMSTVEDESVANKQAAIAAALAGEAVVPTEVAASAPAQAPDLMGQLTAAMEQAGAGAKKPARKQAAQKEKVK